MVSFDWDQWNVQKNEGKHGVSRKEAESVFEDPYACFFDDVVHSLPAEKRTIIYGESIHQRIMMVAYTLREKGIRIISARPAGRKERAIYVEKKKNALH